jgi:hypothetical protein
MAPAVPILVTLKKHNSNFVLPGTSWSNFGGQNFGFSMACIFHGHNDGFNNVS